MLPCHPTMTWDGKKTISLLVKARLNEYLKGDKQPLDINQESLRLCPTPVPPPGHTQLRCDWSCLQ